MNRKAKKILMWLFVAFIVFVVSGFFLPSERVLYTDVTIKAPLNIVFKKVNILSNWEEWAPWKLLDSSVVITLDGELSGRGSGLSWVSKKEEIGTGNLKVIESVPNELLVATVNLKNHQDVNWTFHFSEEGGKSSILWTSKINYGLNIINRYNGLFFDSKIEKQLHLGMDKLKEICEEKAMKYSGLEEVEVDDQLIVSIRRKINQKDMDSMLHTSLKAIFEIFPDSSYKPIGNPVTIYHGFTTDSLDVEVGFPIADTNISNGIIKTNQLTGGLVLSKVHLGSYASMKETYKLMHEYIYENGYGIRDGTMEVLLNNPDSMMSVMDLKTRIVIPIE